MTTLPALQQASFIIAEPPNLQGKSSKSVSKEQHSSAAIAKGRDQRDRTDFCNPF
jgi:hypothetical protein